MSLVRVKPEVVLFDLPQKFPGVTNLLSKVFQLIFGHKINQRCVERYQMMLTPLEDNVGASGSPKIFASAHSETLPGTALPHP